MLSNAVLTWSYPPKVTKRFSLWCSCGCESLCSLLRLALAGAAGVDSCRASGEAAADTLHSQSGGDCSIPCSLLERGSGRCGGLSAPGRAPGRRWEPASDGCRAWRYFSPWKQGPPRSPWARHGRVCPFALLLLELLLYPLAPLPRKGSRERLQLSLCSAEPVQFARIAAMIAGFHQMRGASFLIACVISSRGTHCIKSLIQRAAKGARSGSVRLLLISYTTLTPPQGLYPSERLELAQPEPLEGSRGGKGCVAPLLPPALAPRSGYSAPVSWGLRRVE